jgi:hypothetical protein
MVQNNAQMKRGDHQLIWNARDDKGNALVQEFTC